MLGFCDGLSTNLTVSTPNIASYNWSTFETTASIEVFDAGVYSVTVTDISGCTNSTSVSVNAYPTPEPVITGSMSICAGGTATLSTISTYSSYAWSTGSSNQTTVIDEPGFYFVFVYSDFNCEGYAEFNVSLATSLSPTITGDSIICPGSTTTLDAGVFDSYIWDDPDQSTTQTIDVDNPALYSVTVSDDSGCSGSTSINVMNGASQVLDIMGDSLICPGTSTTLEVDDVFASYAWSNGLNTPAIIVNDADTYLSLIHI